MSEVSVQHFYWPERQLTGQNLHIEGVQCKIRGDTNFKGSHSSGPSAYFLFCAVFTGSDNRLLSIVRDDMITAYLDPDTQGSAF